MGKAKKLSQKDYESKVLELAKKGNTSEKIGELLRKQDNPNALRYLPIMNNAISTSADPTSASTGNLIECEKIH